MALIGRKARSPKRRRLLAALLAGLATPLVALAAPSGAAYGTVFAVVCQGTGDCWGGVSVVNNSANLWYYGNLDMDVVYYCHVGAFYTGPAGGKLTVEVEQTIRGGLKFVRHEEGVACDGDEHTLKVSFPEDKNEYWHFTAGAAKATFWVESSDGFKTFVTIPITITCPSIIGCPPPEGKIGDFS